VAYGFAGMRVSHGELRFAPTLPKQWQHDQFQVQLRGATLRVRVARDGIEYTLAQGDALDFTHLGQPLALTRAAPTARIAMEAQA
jgi:trehalose/maltose hydrolase-like predicted phosphorylase